MLTPKAANSKRACFVLDKTEAKSLTSPSSYIEALQSHVYTTDLADKYNICVGYND